MISPAPSSCGIPLTASYNAVVTIDESTHDELILLILLSFIYAVNITLIMSPAIKIPSKPSPFQSTTLAETVKSKP